MSEETTNVDASALESLNGMSEQDSEQATETQESSESKNIDLSRQFAALSRKEKELREQKGSWESEKAELLAKLEQYESAKKEESTKEELPLEYRLKRNPIQTLQELGYDYEKLTQLVLNDGNLPVEDKLELMKEELDRKYSSELEQVKTRLAEKEAAEEQAKYEQIVSGFKKEIEDHVSGNADDYKFIQASGSMDLIFDVIESHYEETGEILDIKDAAAAVESHIKDEVSKFQGILQPSQAEKPSMPERQSPFTLSNDYAAASSTAADLSLKSREESLAEAAKLIKWDN